MKRAKIRIVTDDVSRLSRFYERITGISPNPSTDRYVEFPAPGMTLAISHQDAMDVNAAGATAQQSNRSTVLDFEVDDVDLERIRLRGLVEMFVLEPTDQPWGNRAMLFRDPDGNLVNVYAPIRAAAA